MSGNVYFPQWRRFSRLPDGFAAPADAVFTTVMLIGLVLYLSLTMVVLACGLGWYALGRTAMRWVPTR
ncbi:MAG: hypothetical protein JWQ94_130 [Tardiphaga sp.]|nr:hypothetical protein [Tardiphaga sp.]